MATEVGVGYVRLIPSMQGFSAAASTAITGAVTPAAQKASHGMAQAFTSKGAAISAVGTKLTKGISLPLAATGIAALKMGGDFEASMNRVGVLSGATGSELEGLRDLAKELGATTQFSASEAADALGFLSMAGFDASQSMEALPGVLDLAAAGQVDLATSADIASNVLSGFGMEAEQIGQVTDVMAQTMTSANTDMMQLGDAMKYVGPVANSAGLSIEETSAAIGLLGNAGIQGSMAGTTLRGAISRLLSPSGEAADALSRLGVSATDSNGELLPMVDIVRQLEESGASTADMMTIFGQRAGPGMAALVEQGSDALEELTNDNFNSAGRAAEVADASMQGFNGAMKELKSAFEGLMIAIGESGLLEWAASAVSSFTGFVQQLSKTNPEMLKIGVAIAAFVAAAGPLLFVVGKIVSTIGTLIKVGKALAVVIKAIGLAVAMNPLGLIITAAALLVVGLIVAYKKSETFRKIVNGALKAVGNAAKWLWNNAIKPAFNFIKNAIGVAMNIARVYMNTWSNVVSKVAGFFRRMWNTAKSIFNSVVGSVRNAISAVGSAFNRVRGFVSNVIGFFRRLLSGIRNSIGNAVNTVRRLPGRLLSAMGNTGRLLLGAGKNIIQGLINGIRNMASRVYDEARRIVSNVRNLLPFSPAKDGPLKTHPMDKAGANMMTGSTGLLAGIRKGAPSVLREMNAVVGDLAASPNVGVDVGFDTASSIDGRRQMLQDWLRGHAVDTGLGAAATAQRGAAAAPGLHISADRDRFSQLLLEVMRYAVRVNSGGNVQAALGQGGRR